MKTLYIGLLGIILILGNACGNKNGEGVSPRSYFRAELNGKDWEGSVKGGFNGENEWYLGAVVYADKQQLIHREVLGIYSIPLHKGKFILKHDKNDSTTLGLPGSNYGTLKDDGDVACDYYDLLLSDSINNYIELTEVGTEQKRFKGRFSVTYLRTNTNICDETKLDTLRFRNGEFFLKLK